jgi:hypothetical protein
VCRAYSRPDVAYRLLQLRFDVRATKPELSRSSQGGRPRPPSFSTVPRPLPCGSGDTRRAAIRPLAMAPVLVVPACAGLPSRDATSTASPRAWGLLPRCIVRIDVHGSKDRAKDASPSACDDLSCLRRVHALCGACRRRSPPRLPSDIRCHRRVRGQRRIPPLAYGPTEALVPTTPREERRLPEDQDAFHRHDTRRMISRAKGLLPPAFAPALSLTPPTRFPQLGKVFLMGIARPRCGHPRIRDEFGFEFESADAFLSRWNCHAWD